MMSSWWRGDVTDSAPPLEPRTGKLTYLGILPPVYTPHPSAGGAAQARPFPLLGPSPCPAPYLCCAGWPATPAQRGWPCEAPHLRRTNWAERAGWRKPAGTRPGQCWARITCWPSFWSTAMVCTVGPDGRIGSSGGTREGERLSQGLKKGRGGSSRGETKGQINPRLCTAISRTGSLDLQNEPPTKGCPLWDGGWVMTGCYSEPTYMPCLPNPVVLLPIPCSCR